MALNKLKFNSINVTPAASEAIRFNSSANGLETADAGGSLVKIAATTASSSSSISFTSGIDSTYKEYIFIFNKIHPSAYASLQFQTSTDGGSSYGVTVTSTVIQTTHDESGSSSSLAYETGLDLAQGTSYQNLGDNTGNDSDQCVSGELHLFNPSSTTFVKHFIASSNNYNASNYSTKLHTAGYINTTSAIDEIQFKFSSGNIDSGTFKLYGIKGS